MHTNNIYVIFLSYTHGRANITMDVELLKRNAVLKHKDHNFIIQRASTKETELLM